MEASTVDAEGVVTHEDEVFDLSAIKRIPGGGVSYVDPVLAEVGQKLKELELIERELNRQKRQLKLRAEKRLKALDALGSLAQYPTATQRRVLATFEQAVALGNAAMIQITYGMCLEGECEKTNWKSKQGEPLAMYYARVMTELASPNDNEDEDDDGDDEDQA
jgi:hypothetical protein